MKFNEMMKGRYWVGVLVLLMAGGLLMAGCESDSVSPDDPVPELTELQAAQLAGRVAFGISEVGPRILTFRGSKPRDKDLGVYPYEFPAGGDITGTIVLEYFEGGAEGNHSSWEEADYGLLYTPGSTVLTAAKDIGGTEVVLFEVSFNLFGDINQSADRADILGSGNLTVGSFSSDFTIPEDDPVVLLGVSSFPESGMFLLTVSGIELLVIYDGDSTAGVLVGGVPAYVIDLETGDVTPIS